MKKPNGYIIYDGVSQLNGEHIIAIVTMKSANIKTGNMASMWIMHKDVRPTEASKTGDDAAVCGQCPQRHHLGGACYVTLFQAPLNVWKSYHKGNYEMLTDYSVFEGIRMRFGAYGDPAAIPMDVLVGIKSVVINNTSYTHQWKTTDKKLMEMSMASVDNITEARQAVEMGYRYFRVTHDEDSLIENEIICPNYTSDVQCYDCKLCSGNLSKAKNIVIPVHGAKSKKFIEEN